MSLVDRFWAEHRLLVREAMRLTMAFLEAERTLPSGAGDRPHLLVRLKPFRKHLADHVDAEERWLLPAVRARGTEGRRLADHYRVCLGASAQQIMSLLDDAAGALETDQPDLGRRWWDEAMRCLARRIELEERRYFPIFRVYLVLPPGDFL